MTYMTLKFEHPINFFHINNFESNLVLPTRQIKVKSKLDFECWTRTDGSIWKQRLDRFFRSDRGLIFLFTWVELKGFFKKRSSQRNCFKVRSILVGFFLNQNLRQCFGGISFVFMHQLYLHCSGSSSLSIVGSSFFLATKINYGALWDTEYLVFLGS